VKISGFRHPAMPRVSVIMPCYNHAQFVVESANGILAQTHNDLELIIVDDCSSDNSWETIKGVAQKDSRVKIIRHDFNQGASKSRNDGLRAANGQFIGFCDADDVWETWKLIRQMKLLEENPDYDVVYGDAIIIDVSGSPTGQRFSELFPVPKATSGWLFRELVVRNFINMQGVLMRKECVQSAGYFDEEIKWVEDWWYWVRLSRHHRFLYSKEPLAKYRVHGRSTNRVQKRSCCVNRFKVYHRILQQYTDLPVSAKREVIYNMGAELCDLGKRRAGRRLLWDTIKLSMIDLRAFSTFCRALRRIVRYAPAPLQ
jgi:glycosyltransferase involved in cell wall biosynthesis